MKPTVSASSTPRDELAGPLEPSLTDWELAARVIRNTSDAATAYHQLYCRYASDILAFLQTRLPSGTTAEDVAQDVWMTVFQKLKSFDGQNFRAWLYEIARNRAIDILRRVIRRNEKDLGDAPVEDLVSDSLEVDDRLVALRDCLQQLDGPFIRTLIGNRLDGYSVEELARREQIQVATIYTRIDRAKRQLGECIQRKLA